MPSSSIILSTTPNAGDRCSPKKPPHTIRQLPARLRKPGVYRLKCNLVFTPCGDQDLVAIQVCASNVIVEFQGHTLSQSTDSADTPGVIGVLVQPNLSNIVLRGGTISSFSLLGTLVLGGTSQVLLDHMTYLSSGYNGSFLGSDGNLYSGGVLFSNSDAQGNYTTANQNIRVVDLVSNGHYNSNPAAPVNDNSVLVLGAGFVGSQSVQVEGLHVSGLTMDGNNANDYVTGLVLNNVCQSVYVRDFQCFNQQATGLASSIGVGGFGLQGFFMENYQFVNLSATGTDFAILVRGVYIQPGGTPNFALPADITLVDGQVAELNGPGLQTALGIFGSSHVVVWNAALQNINSATGPYPIFFGGVTDGYFENVHLEGITASNAWGPDVTAPPTGVAVYLPGCDNLTFKNCSVRDLQCTNGGPTSTGGCNAFLVDGCTDVRFEDCQVVDVASGGQYVAPPIGWKEISGSTGISYKNCGVQGLTATDATVVGAGLYLASPNGVVQGSLINTVQGYGIQATPGSTQSLVANNQILNCSVGGIQDTTGNAQTAANIYQGNEVSYSGAGNSYPGVPGGTPVVLWQLSEGIAPPFVGRLENVSVV